MTTVISHVEQAVLRGSASQREEAAVELEYHALMGVFGGDTPTHVRSFDRDVFGPSARPARGQHGEQARDHTPTL